MASVESKKRKKAHKAKQDAEQAATGGSKAAAAEALVPRAIMLQEQPTQLTTEAERPVKKSKSKKRQAEAGAGAPVINGVGQPADAVAAKHAKLKRKKQNGLAAEPAAEPMADTAEPSKLKKKQKASKQVPESSTLPLKAAVAALTAPGTAPAKEKKGMKRSRAAGAQPASMPEAAVPAAAGAQPASVPEAAVPAAAVADGIDKKVKKRRKKAEGDSVAAPALEAEAADKVPDLKLRKRKRQKAAAEQAAGEQHKEDADAATPFAAPDATPDQAAADTTSPQVAQSRHRGSSGLQSNGSCGTGAKAFQRVKDDEWLGKRGSWSNSYADTFGEAGWGAKASATLQQVRGKDFRHEKTKKKRGSYRGGLIDNHINSYKFESDDE